MLIKPHKIGQNFALRSSTFRTVSIVHRRDRDFRYLRDRFRTFHGQDDHDDARLKRSKTNWNGRSRHVTVS